ncbi:hypothetical protein [Spirosoma sordidisoli]|uniref:Uncharacterized protein n=1 Tax=Spirosoma sordidisoli TaxID=2502893 RepID=A0A4Q2UHN0_9BACT|nr:hypothetical protein [Spirosoma sordidisoli]RYC66971.1 hypothetical protein EQG79_26720 [Spirosoma sordidisoli]
MNQSFKLRFDQMRDNNPTSDNISLAEIDSDYHAPGHARNLCLVWPDGRKVFLNYAYLIEAEFDVGSEKNIIRLNFSAHNVLLQGYGLDRLFMELLDHLPRIIKAADERYTIETEESAIITNIVVSQHH